MLEENAGSLVHYRVRVNPFDCRCNGEVCSAARIVSGKLWVSSEKGDTWPEKSLSIRSNKTSRAGFRQGVKAVLEEVLEEEMTEHPKAGYRELTPPRCVSATAATPRTP
jgi:hypothetical protein